MNKTIKKSIIIASALLVLGGGTVGGITIYQQQATANTEVEVRSVNMLSTQYWPGGTNVYGNVTTDFIQELYPDSQKNISKVFVQQGDTVKKGDPLVEYDRIKLELESEMADLGIEKTDLSISTVEKELQKLQNTTPYIPPAPDPEPPMPEPPGPEPTPVPSKAVLHQKIDLDAQPYKGTGTSEDPFVFLCTEDCTITPAFLKRMLGIAAPTPSPSPMPSPSAEPTAAPSAAPIPTAEPTAEPTAGPTEPPAPTAEPTASPVPPTAEPVPTPTPEATAEPLPEGGVMNLAVTGKGAVRRLTAESTPQPTPLPTPPTGIPEGSEPFAAVFEVRENNNENEALRYAWAIDGTDFSSGFKIPLILSAPDDLDLGLALLSAEGSYNTPGSGDIGGGDAQYTQEELTKLIKQKKQEIEDFKLQRKQAVMTANKAKRDLDNATVKSVIDGEVRTLTDLETATADGKPFLTVSGGTGMYLNGTVSEAMLGQIHVGDEIVASSWETGMTYTGKVVEISDYPVTANGYSSSDNPNNSSYQMTAYIEDPGDLYNGAYLDVTVGSGQTDNGLYLDAAYIRKDAEGYYVLKADGEQRIQKQYITTGKSIYNNMYSEILSGVTREDKLAFPYGKTAVIGAKAKDPEGDGFVKW